MPNACIFDSNAAIMGIIKAIGIQFMHTTSLYGMGRLVVTTGENVNVTFNMKVATVEETVTVTAETPLVVFAHRQLFELFPSWDWTTADGARVLEVVTHHVARKRD